jgi:hypothetical protein
MGVGQSWGGGFVLKTETAFGSLADLSSGATTIPIKSESLAMEHPRHVYGNILTSRSAYGTAGGVITGGGNFTLEADAVSVGLPMLYWNGQVSSAALPGISTAPTGVVSSGGALPVGDYYYKVAAVWSHTVLGMCVANSSASSAKISTTTGNLTVALSWTDPATLTPPAGWTYAGTAVSRTAAGGSAGSEKFLHFESGSGLTWSNATTAALTTAIPATSVYAHTYVPAAVAASTNPLLPFSVGVLKDNDESEQYYGCRMNTFSLSVGDADAPAEMTFELMAQRAKALANFSPSPSVIAPVMNWQAYVLQDDALLAGVEAIEISATNNLEAVPQLAGVNYVREFYPGERTVSGTITVAFENHDQYDKMMAGTSFELQVFLYGQATTATGAVDDGLGNAISAWPYAIQVDLWQCYYTGGGANLSGRDRLVAQFPFVAVYNTTGGEEMQVTVYNKTASYA